MDHGACIRFTLGVIWVRMAIDATGRYTLKERSLCVFGTTTSRGIIHIEKNEPGSETEKHTDQQSRSNQNAR